MKKAIKGLMSALFVLSVLVLGTSCSPEADSLNEINPADLVIGAGTYDYKAVMSASTEEQGVTIKSSESMFATVEVKGTDPDSEVIMSNAVMEMKNTAVCPNAEVYALMKAEMSENPDPRVSFDDDNYSFTMTETDKIDDEEKLTYAEFIGDSIARDENIEDLKIYQSKDGVTTKIEGTMSVEGMKANITTTITRK